MLFKRFVRIFSCYLLAFTLTFSTPIPTLVGDGVMLLEASTGQVLYSKNGYEPFYPASTTKILTSFILAYAPDMNKIVTQTDESLSVVPSDSSSIGLSSGDSYTYYDGLHAILMRSDNYVSYDMAVDYIGSIDEFANTMIDISFQLGAYSSIFTNPHGYHDENHVTTPYDLALITREAFSHELVAQIASTPTYTFTNITTGETMTFNHTAPFFDIDSPYYNPHIVAAKTGYHTPAGRTLAAKASSDHLDLIAVTMHSGTPSHFEDINKLVEYGMLNYRLVKNPVGVSSIENISYADWAKFYIEQASEMGYFTPTLKNYYSPLSTSELYQLLRKIPNHFDLTAAHGRFFTSIKQPHAPLSLQQTQTLLNQFARTMDVLLPDDFVISYLETFHETIPETISLQDGIYLQQCLISYLNFHSPHFKTTFTFTSY